MPTPILIGDKLYHKVQDRINAFKTDTKGEYDLVTEIISNTNENIVIKAILTFNNHIYIGHAERSRKMTGNKKLEKAETGAIGRALAAAGYGGGLDEEEEAEILKKQATQRATQQKQNAENKLKNLINGLEDDARKGTKIFDEEWGWLSEQDRLLVADREGYLKKIAEEADQCKTIKTENTANLVDLIEEPPK